MEFLKLENTLNLFFGNNEEFDENSMKKQVLIKFGKIPIKFQKFQK